MATTMIGLAADRREQPPSAGRRWIPAALCGVVALSFAGWAMVISGSVTGLAWWEEASARLVGVFVTVVGVVVWIRRPTPRMGQLMVLCGAVYYFQHLRAADGILFTVGFCLAYAWLGVTAHLALAWPTGTLEGWIDRSYVICFYFISTSTQIIRYLVDQPRSLWVRHLAQVNTLWAVVGSASGAVMGLLGIALLVHRWVGSTPVKRRPDGPVWTALAVAALVKIAEAMASILAGSAALQATLDSLFYLAVIVLIPVLYLIR